MAQSIILGGICPFPLAARTIASGTAPMFSFPEIMLIVQMEWWPTIKQASKHWLDRRDPDSR